ncbi:dethiobiotin synthase [Haloarcula sp. CBA1130]|uniref:dethiobiotin synthase n=1 Tax=unclassified Haloarcula TaxID=2624677 RepID=UPI001247D7EF|nr:MULTISPECIES: dethiobiotin synthase [unclassified Haloarcula]KAA9397400.1 dethiobiotin synthase [Haloarcula sp. CBA1129]KAA9402566.1 dethiobiotin synthase [Haloarcula sp. CBA1130]
MSNTTAESKRESGTGHIAEDGVFVVGTDTGVGKTVVTAGLTGWLRDMGTDAVAVKPCQTGYPPDDDAAFVESICDTPDAAVCLERLSPPLAPEVAAREADDDITLSYESIRDGVTDVVAESETAVVEGIGGLRVPLADGREVIDLVADIGLPAMVVARSGLGTLNHTALTVQALRQNGVPVVSIVLNEYEGATTAERTNPNVIERMTGCSVWPVPPLDIESSDSVIDGLRAHLPQSVLRPAIER